MTQAPFIGPLPEGVERSEPPEPPRRRNWLVITVAAVTSLVLVGAAVAVPFAVQAYRAATAPTLDEVRVYDDVRRDHTDGLVDYDPGPPPGGPHADAWHDCGVYDEPVREENAVHSLEHGTVWITYDPEEVSDGDVALLADLLPERGILSPYPGQETPLILTVWERQLLIEDADDRRVPLFLQEYADGHTAPEPMASCAGGVRIAESEDAPTGVKI